MDEEHRQGFMLTTKERGQFEAGFIRTRFRSLQWDLIGVYKMMRGKDGIGGPFLKAREPRT